MPPTISRRAVLLTGAAGAAALARPTLGAETPAANAEPDAPAALPDSYPTADAGLVASIVGASHFNYDRVKALLAEHPGLAKAAWDWGFGDWETALGAASHTGQIEIVEMLLASGARPDVFTFAVLDRVEAVRSVVETVPDARTLAGPHGIPLIRHARAGKADRVIDYLESIGLADDPRAELSKADAERFMGEYAWGPGEAERFVVGYNQRASMLSLARTGGTARNLFPTSTSEITGGTAAFSPAGAPHVTVRFGPGLPPETLTVEGSGPAVRATRVSG